MMAPVSSSGNIGRTGVSRRDRARLLGASGAAAFVLLALIALLPLLSSLPLLSALLAGFLYVVSHLLRAFRLGILSMDMLGVSGRTAVLMHLSTVPISLALPLKLGELTRLYELWRLSGTFVYSAVVLLVDRMYDSLFLFPLLAFLLVQGNAAPALIALTSVAAFVPLAVIVVGPHMMTEVQRYVVIHHNGAATTARLRVIDLIRRIVTHAAGVAREQAPTLVVLSVLIWLLELMVCATLITAVTGTANGMFDLLGGRLTASWWTVDSDPLIQSVIALTLVATLLPWPIAIFYYLGRRMLAISPRAVPESPRGRARL